MSTTYDFKDNPLVLRKGEEYAVGDDANYHELDLFVSGFTDLLIKIKNTDGAQGITIDINWTLDKTAGGDGWTDAIGSDPTLASDGVDVFRFSNKFYVVNDGTNDHDPVDPAFPNVLPCTLIRVKVYATTGSQTSSFKIWIQGTTQRR